MPPPFLLLGKVLLTAIKIIKIGAIFSMDLEQQKQIQAHFEGMYKLGQKPWVDHGREITLDKFFKILKKRYSKAKILDMGCGDGWISIYAARQGHEVWGLDSSETAIAEAKVKAKTSGVDKKVHFQVGDALNLPYKKNSLDALIDRGLFHHILPPNRELYFENILKVLKLKGLVYLSVFSTKNPIGIGQLFTKDLVKKLFGRYFEIVSYDEDAQIYPAHLMHFVLERSQVSIR